MLKEFKEFAIKGNVIDMAVGVIIGGAFGKIVTSLVNDIIMPVIAFFTGQLDFSNLFVTLDMTNYETLAEAQAAGAVVLNYGSFITTIIDFIIIAFSIFIFVNKIANKTEKSLAKYEEKLKRKLKKGKENGKPIPPPPKPTTKICPYCKTKIDIDASRCPNCTSHLEEAKVTEKKEETEKEKETVLAE